MSGLALAGGALLATAGPALAAPTDSPGATTADTGYTESNPTDEGTSYRNAEGGQQPSSDPAAIDGETPTPAAEGAPYGDEQGGPEVGGVPLAGTLESVQRATSILPGSSPGDYA